MRPAHVPAGDRDGDHSTTPSLEVVDAGAIVSVVPVRAACSRGVDDQDGVGQGGSEGIDDEAAVHAGDDGVAMGAAQSASRNVPGCGDGMAGQGNDYNDQADVLIADCLLGFR